MAEGENGSVAMAAAEGLILFAHGARDPAWAEPLRALRAMLTEDCPQRRVDLAFLELMTPDLAGAVAEQVAAGVQQVVVVPVFFGRGGHLQRDLPRLLAELRAVYPQMAIRCLSAVGEWEALWRTLATEILRRSAGLVDEKTPGESS